ncbi:hypothetical protein JOM56_003750 [Amanita muscaria]
MPSPDPSFLPADMYPLQSPPPQRTKRRQVKNACTNCQKACKKCDDARPCLRCVKYGIQEACVSSQRKERKRGVKRGPYKKRGPKAFQPDSSCRQETHLPQPMPIASAAPPFLPSYLPVGLPATFYAPHHPSKNGGAPPLYHPYFLSQMPPHPLQAPHNGQDDVDPNHPPQPGPYYSAALVAQFSPSLYPQYAVPRPDQQPLPQNIHYAFFPPAK